ncbi:hypothetical protein FNV43_RR00589 [Rhamnella rubrinervis]|uniref:Uncharacterized protein n=1 Tax=Rhamnella rubrinervis TaxID=2594499 RepID=A0A8K0MRB1_9ROSA|nr:hypothetical protein FNV43_RR00589 [Rhamnella rubrinervis]
MSTEESHATLKPYLVYSDPSSASTHSFDYGSSSVRVRDPNQKVEQNFVPYTEPSAGRDNPNEHRPRFFIQHPILIKTDIHSILTPEDMSYLKERYGFPNNVVLSAPRKREKAGSVRDGWIYMPIFLHFFYLKPREEGRYTFYAQWQISLRAIKAGKKNTSSSRGNVCSIQLACLTLEFIQHGLKRLLDNRASRRIRSFQTVYRTNSRSEPTDPLWASYSAANMEKMKVRILTDAELAEKERKKKEKKAAQKASESAPNLNPEPTLDGTLVQDYRYFTEMIIKMDNAFKKKTAALNNLIATNKSLEDEDEPKKDAEPEKTPSPTKDSFMEVINADKAEGTEPIANTGEVFSTAQPNRGDLP